jgi:hypothetical protein
MKLKLLLGEGFALEKERLRVAVPHEPLVSFVLVEQTELAGHLEDLALVADYIVAPRRLRRGTTIGGDRPARPVRAPGLRRWLVPDRLRLGRRFFWRCDLRWLPFA